MLSELELQKIVNQTNLTRLICKVDKFGASSSRKTYLGNCGGVNYKLRKCFSEIDASDIESRVLDVSGLGIFPTLFGRYEEWLVFEYLEFPESQRVESNQFWYNLGGAIAKLETIPALKVNVGFGGVTDDISKEEFSLYLRTCVDLLEKTTYLQKIQAVILYDALDLFFELKPNYCYGYLDLLPGNILKKGQEPIFIDEEGLAKNIQGLSLIRPLDIWKQYSPPKGLDAKERKNLLLGYAEGGANKEFYEKNELQIGAIYYLLKSADSVWCSGKTNNSIKQLISRINLL